LGNFQKKGCFFNFEWEKQISPFLAPSGKNLEKYPGGPHLEKILPTPMDREYTFVANSYTVPLEKDLKIDANGVRAFMGHFLCGVETAKRFVNIRLHCNVSNQKKISKMSTLHTPWKNFC